MACKESKSTSVGGGGSPRVSFGQEEWPPRIASARNAGVLIVGRSTMNGDVASVLLGGRLYKGRQVYEYTDFGGGLEKAEWAQPQLGAFREFAEELFGLSEEDARSIAPLLWDAAKPALVGDAPLVHKGYAMFLVPAEALLPVLQQNALLQPSQKGASAIDHLLAAGKKNPELTSLALVGVSEFLSAVDGHGQVTPLCIRNLDGMQRDSGVIALRQLMVGPGGSIATCWDWLESFTRSMTSVMTLTALQVCPAVTFTVPPKDRIPIIFDMETGDPDDVLTLLFLVAHSSVDLKAVTVTNSGSRDQVSLVRWLLREVGLGDVRVGAQDWPQNFKHPPLAHPFYRNFGRLRTETEDCEPAKQVLLECCDQNTTLVTGGPVNNLAAAIASEGFRLGRWVAQGGFAGQGVVPEHLQMDKFKGRTYNRTFNFGSDPQAAKCALTCKAIHRRVCVSKNVCHRTVYDGGVGGWHESVAEALRATNATGGKPQRSKALEIMHSAMSEYLAHKPSGKMLHDPLALAVALDESTCALAEVQFETEGDRWGCWLCPGSGTWVAVDYDEEIFRRTLLKDGFQAATSVHTRIVIAGQAASSFSQTEKDFMKVSRAVRDILKIERRVDSGDRVEASQKKKMNRKYEFLAELRRLELCLGSQSDVRAKFADVLILLSSEASCPLAQDHFGKDCTNASELTLHGSSVPAMVELDVPTQALAVAFAKIEPPLAVKDKKKADTVSAADNSVDCHRVPQLALVAGATAVDESADAHEKVGRRWQKRGGRSHFIRKYEADHA